MKTLTFNGFLKRYIRELSGMETLSIKKLTLDALPVTSRIAEPLYLYASLTNQHERLQRLTSIPYYRDEFGDLNTRFPHAKSLLKALETNSEDVPSRYEKVYSTYRAMSEKSKTDREFCSSTRVLIRKLQEDMHISNYRIYKDLELNPGNINDFLSNGALGHIGRQTAGRILSYLQEKLK